MLVRFLVLIVFLVATSFASVEEANVEDRLPSSKKCTPDRKVIKKLLHGYEKNVDPRGVVDVEAEIWLSDVEKVCSKSATAVIDAYLNEKWIDPRLNYEKQNPCHTAIKVDVTQLWSPSMVIVNSRTFEIHESPAKNVFTLIYANGTVWNDYRAKIGLGCTTAKDCNSMTCTFTQESYLYSTEKVVLRPANPAFSVFGSGSLPDWEYAGNNVTLVYQHYPAGEWTEMTVTLKFERRKNDKCEV